MKKKIVLLALVSVFLLSAMVVSSVAAQPRIVGVNIGEWFKYGDIVVDWSSNNPNATFPPPHGEWLKEFNETEWMLYSVVDVSGTNITFEVTGHFKNGTEKTECEYIDIDTGNGNMTFIAISADLSANDTIYASGSYSTWKINETIARIYPEGARETNHLNMTLEQSWTVNGTDYYYCISKNFYWDRLTGILVERSFEEINQTGEYLTTLSVLFRITESNVWVVPEFPIWTSILLVFVILTVAIAIYKPRPLKTLTH